MARWRLTRVENGDHPPVISWSCTGCGSTRLQCGDCTNVETMCATVLEENIRRTGANVDYDEAHSRLVLEAWRLYLSWRPIQDPDRPPVNYEGFAYSILRRRAHDIYRQMLGRNGEKPLANAISLSWGDDGEEYAHAARPSGDQAFDVRIALMAAGSEA